MSALLFLLRDSFWARRRLQTPIDLEIGSHLGAFDKLLLFDAIDTYKDPSNYIWQDERYSDDVIINCWIREKVDSSPFFLRDV